MPNKSSAFKIFFGRSGGNQSKPSPSGFHSLADEAQRQTAAYDLDEAERAALREVNGLDSFTDNIYMESTRHTYALFQIESDNRLGIHQRNV